MCSPPLPAANDISAYWTEEKILMTLKEIKNGSPLPENFIPHNPCHYYPKNLSAGTWYFISSGIQMEADTGSWKTMGEACIIFEGPDFIGWRTSYKYYGDQDPNACQPDWIMQEYKITSKEMLEKNCPKDTGSLCRVFLSSAQGPSTDGHKNLTGIQNLVGEESPALDFSGPVGEDIIRNGQGSGSRSHDYNKDDENILGLVADGLLNHPAENMPEIDGDFLELLDLDDSARSSSSSENSSCISMNSDDCFDSLESLRDLEPEVSSHGQQKSADSSSGGPRGTIVKRGASSKKTKILKYFCFLLD